MHGNKTVVIMISIKIDPHIRNTEDDFFFLMSGHDSFDS